MTTAQAVAIALVALPALALVLWPVLRRGGGPGLAAREAPAGRTLELEEEKTAILRALREIDFDREAGHLSDDDHAGLRARYEARAAQIVTELDRLRPAAPPEPGPADSSAPVARPSGLEASGSSRRA